MRKLTLSFLMVIGTLISSFSQTSYPKKILWGNDTVLAITKPQLVKINRSLNDYIHLKEINRNLQMDIRASDSLCFYWKQIATKTDTLYLMETKKCEQLHEINDVLQDSLNKNKSETKKIGIGIGICGTILGVLLGVLLGK